MAAWICSFFKKGYSFSISSMLMPPAKDSRITSTDIRVPAIMGFPPKIFGFLVIIFFILIVLYHLFGH